MPHSTSPIGTDIQDGGYGLPRIPLPRLSEKSWKHPSVALQTTVKALLDPFRPPHKVRIRLRSPPRTPFRTVSPRTSVNKGRRRGESYWASPLPALLVRFLIGEGLIDLPCPGPAYSLHCHSLYFS